MTDIELIDRLCSVNMLLSDIVREQVQIMAQHGIRRAECDDPDTDMNDLFSKCDRADRENDAIEAELRGYV